jgi:hypothetical protein
MRTRVLVTAVIAVACVHAVAQQPSTLRDLLAEADKNNCEILAAQREWKASTHVRAQVTALPPTEFTLQDFSVGSPRPGAGLSNSNFAYVGIGASQQIPYPGKLRLRAPQPIALPTKNSLRLLSCALKLPSRSRRITFDLRTCRRRLHR